MSTVKVPLGATHSLMLHTCLSVVEKNSLEASILRLLLEDRAKSGSFLPDVVCAQADAMQQEVVSAVREPC